MAKVIDALLFLICAALILTPVLVLAEVTSNMAALHNPSGVTGNELPEVRQGAPLTLQAQIAALYEDAANKINHDLGTAIERLGREPESRAAGFAEQRARALVESVNRRLARLNIGAEVLVRDAASRAWTTGGRQAHGQLAELGLEPAARGLGMRFTFTDADRDAVERVAQDTLARLNGAARQHGAQSVQMFRTLSAGPLAGAAREAQVNQAIARGIITGDPNTADRAIRELFRDPTSQAAETYRRIGAKQIEVGGWTGPVRTYVSTVVRTRTREATVSGRHERLARANIQLVQITGRVSGNFCTRFIGLVCSIGAPHPEYPQLSELPSGGPPFHPNCSKGTAAYIEDLVSTRRAAAAEKSLATFRRAQAAGTLEEDLR